MYDRFMDTQHSVQKEQLQLLGVTCLFIASKIEVWSLLPCVYSAMCIQAFFPVQEIYPPKVADFAYVTDGACTAIDILEMELIICKVTVKGRQPLCTHTLMIFAISQSGIMLGVITATPHFLGLGVKCPVSQPFSTCIYLREHLIHLYYLPWLLTIFLSSPPPLSPSHKGSELEIKSPLCHCQLMDECVHAACQ